METDALGRVEGWGAYYTWAYSVPDGADLLCAGEPWGEGCWGQGAWEWAGGHQPWHQGADCPGVYFIICTTLFTFPINLIYSVHHYHWCVLRYLCLTVHISCITLTYSVLPAGVYFVICTSLFTFSIALLCNVHHYHWCLIWYLCLTVHIPYHPDMQCTSLPLVCTLLFVPHCSYSLSPWYILYMYHYRYYTDHSCILSVVYTTLFPLCVCKRVHCAMTL